MRQNLPITQKEYELPQDALLVSYTDLHGNITLANEAFVEASGFTYKELLGQPHNMLRHPDVPEQVFFDFWQTIQDGRPWNQIVKNRRKNGDHYWVEANATPLIENGEITGFMSIRRPATQQQVSDAEKLYEQINAKKVALQHGGVKSNLAKFNLLTNINPPVTTIPAALVAITVFVLELLGMSTSLWLEALLMLLTIIASAHALYFVYQIKNSIGSIDDVANSNLQGEIYTNGENLGGVLNRRIKTMQIRLNASHNDFLTQENSAQRLRSGLNNLNSYIMIADRTRTITYVNPALQEFLKSVEADFRKELPHFNADELVGQNIDSFHKKPEHQINILNQLSERMTTRIEVAGHSLQLVISPILDDQRNPIGTIVEWQDVFQEMYVQDEIKNLVNKANAGVLDGRINTDALDGFYKELGQQFNSLMSSLQSIFDEISYIVSGLSDGDLTRQSKQTFEGQYQQAIKQLVGGVNDLRIAFCKVDGESEEVNTVAKQVTESNMSLEDAISHQVEDMKATSLALQEVTEQIKDTTQKASESDKLASETQSVVHKGSQYMEEAIDSMRQIEEVSEKISGIVSLIDGIAFQTNLLALNAAVEAARAGEHGRGFAVVAGEVRQLAQKSAEAAKEITALVESSSQKIQEGSLKVVVTGEELKKIEDFTKQVVENISVISKSSKQQLASIGEVNQAVKRVEATANQSKEQVQENSALATFLGQVSEHMDELVGKFSLGDCRKIDETVQKQSSFSALVVEDQLPNQKIAEAMLKKLGFNVDVVGDGQQGVNQVKLQNYDLILMDLSMPVKDGITAAREMRQMGVKCPIYAYTGKSETFFNDCNQGAMNGLLVKPLNFQKLQKLCQSITQL